MRKPPRVFEAQGPCSRMIHQVIAGIGLPFDYCQTTIHGANGEHYIQCGLPYPGNIAWVAPLQRSIVCKWSETSRVISTTLEIDWPHADQSTPSDLEQVDLTYNDGSG